MCIFFGVLMTLMNLGSLSDYNVTNSTPIATTPNIDTLYDQAFLDLRDGPVLLSYNAIEPYSRFHTFQCAHGAGTKLLHN